MNVPQMLELAQRVVGEAEKRFTAGLGSDPTFYKGPGNFATDVDVALERFIRTELKAATGIPVLGEESGGEYDPRAVWVVDPIDGTSNYAAGNPMCAILVSLILDDQPRLGVTSIPMLGRRLSAQESGPVHLNGRALDALVERDPAVAQVGFSSLSSSSSSAVTSGERRAMVGMLADGPVRPRITGSIGVDLALTAQGVFDGAISFSPYVWDNAAGVALVRAAGGVVTDINGEPWSPRSTGVVAGTRSAHDFMMSTINRIRQN